MGIQYSEMESIMQFIYLGEATFYEERMDEFLAVAKSLEIKELCNAETDTNDEPDNEPSPNDQETPTEMSDEKNDISYQMKIQAPKERKRRVVSVGGKYECNKTSSSKQSVHQCDKYACSQCDFQGTKQSNLTLHIQSKQEGVKYACDQCDYQATRQDHLRRHIQATHEGTKYSCDQCDFRTTRQDYLRHHIQVRHE